MKFLYVIKNVTLSLFILIIFHAHCTVAQLREEYLNAAVETAQWLTAIEIDNSATETISWPRSSFSPNSTTGLDEGSAGIGEFFLKLYKVTHNAEHLEQAQKAADHVDFEYQRNNFNGPDWLAGAAGGGMFFLDLYKETGLSTELLRAKFAADWLMRTAYKDSSGYYWRHSPTLEKIYTGIAHGAAGIGMFFLDLFEQSPDSVYLAYAEGAFRWTTQYTVRFDSSSIGWKRLTTDTVANHQWCGGSAGILFFLNRLYQTTHKEIYKRYLEQTAIGLMNQAVQTNGGAAWHYTTDDHYSFPIIYCHGTASVVHALYAASNVLSSTNFKSMARNGVRWLKSAKKISTSGDGYWPHIYDWDQFDTGLFTGTASVGHAFLKYYEFENDSTYLSEAKSAGAYLLSVAQHPEMNQTRWINYTSPDNPEYDQKTYYTGLYSGSAGVGYFLVELYESMVQAGDFGTHRQDAQPAIYAVLSNYPNPFNPGTDIQFDIPSDSPVSVEIYDLLGKKIQVLPTPNLSTRGTHRIRWNGNNDAGHRAASGIYLVRLTWSGGFLYHKIMLLK